MRVLFASVVLLSLIVMGPGVPASSRAQGARPNIIFILTDDLDTRSIAVMPRLKTHLADAGVTFVNFFVTTALCCPSRASILRGQYVHNHRTYTNTPPAGGFEIFKGLGREQSTAATWLRAAGYRTVLMGKYLNGYPERSNPTYVPPGWDEWYSPARGGYANFTYTMNENRRLVEYGSRPEDYMTDVLARTAVDVIRRSAQDGRPFFIYLATYAPHAPATPAPRHAGAFAGVTAPRPPSFNEADVADKPQWLRNRSPLTERQIAAIDTQHRSRLQSLLAVDELIGGLVDALRASGQLDRTYIFFTSDNGYHMGEHRLPPGKNTAFDEDIRVPMLVRGPAVPAGRTVEQIGLNIDFAPTFAAIAAVHVPEFVDGRSLLPLFRSARSPWRQAFTVEHYTGGPVPPRFRGQRRLGPQAIPEFHAIRTRDALYVEYETKERELYDRRRDPFELTSVVESAPPAVLARLAARLAELEECAGQACRAAEDQPLDLGGR